MANKKLKEFIANVKTGGLMRTSRYSVLFSPPKGLVGKVGDNRKLLMFCSEASLPGVQVVTNPIRTFGEVTEAPNDRMFDNVNLTFYVDQNMEVKHYFDSWVNLIQNANSRVFRYYKDYITDVIVQVEDARDESRYLVVLKEAYPKAISPIQLGYESKEVMKLQVSMNYKYWNYAKVPASGKREPGPWDAFTKLPTINNKEIGDYFGGFNKFQDNANRLPEVKSMETAVTDPANY